MLPIQVRQSGDLGWHPEMISIDMQGLSLGVMGSGIAWLYIVTNAARLITYIPQIVVVWRCHDGARSVSLLTWGSWVVANLSATLYGAFVVRDTFFTAISLVNLVCCGLVTAIAARRRAALQKLIGPNATR